MAKGRNKTSKKRTSKKAVVQSTRISESAKDSSFFERIQSDIEKNNSFLNLILGALIVIVLGILVFNYFNKDNSGSLGPAQQTENTQKGQDVAKDKLPGKYTVKEGDTLFIIAQNYYEDGYKFDQIAKANSIANPNAVEVGTVLKIPKLEATLAAASSTPAPTSQTSALPQATSPPADADNGTGGAENQTIWGERITTDTYTIQAGDWLSKIAGRAYGDIMAYDKIAKANNIQNPDAIEVGIVLKIPR